MNTTTYLKFLDSLSDKSLMILDRMAQSNKMARLSQGINQVLNERPELESEFEDIAVAFETVQDFLKAHHDLIRQIAEEDAA